MDNKKKDNLRKSIREQLDEIEQLWRQLGEQPYWQLSEQLWKQLLEKLKQLLSILEEDD